MLQVAFLKPKYKSVVQNLHDSFIAICINEYLFKYFDLTALKIDVLMKV